MTIINEIPATTTTAPAGGDAGQVWLADEPTTTLGALLHTEVGHPGTCYTGRALWALGASVPLGAAAAITYTVATHLRDGGELAQALSQWAQVSPVTAVLALLASALLCVAAVVGDHWLWHREEARYVRNVVHAPADEQP